MIARLRQHWPPGIRLQLTAWYSAILLLVLGLAAVAFYGAFKFTLQDRVTSDLQTHAQHIAAGISAVNGTIVIHDVTGTLPGLGTSATTDFTASVAEGVLVRVLDTHGTPVYASPAMRGLRLPDASVTAPLQGDTWQDAVRVEGADFIEFYSQPLTSRNHVYGIVQVGEPLDLVTTTLARSVLIFLALAPFLILLSGAGSYWLAGRAFAPMHRLIRLTNRIQASDLQERVPVPAARDEVRELAQTFNDLLARLDTAFVVQRRFVADASHDLRTPVAAILSLAENARDQVAEQDPRGALEDIAGQAQRLRQLITNLLQLSRADEGRLTLEREPVRLDMLAQDVVVSLAPLATERGITLRAGPLDHATVQGDLSHLILVLMNLIDNALTYTPAGGTVTVGLRRQATTVDLLVQDTGMGIAPADLPHIFDRFYRADPARQRATGGTGLGLAIVQTLVATHDGRVSVTSAPQQGATFTVTLPLAHP